MSNGYYNATGSPGTGSEAASATMRAEFAAIQAGFDLLPTVSGNGSLPIFVNAGATALEATTASTARSRLGLGTIATQDANNVQITAGNIQSANATITGGKVTGLSQFNTNNATITGGSATGLTNLGASNAALTGGSATSISPLTSNNAQITGGAISGVTFSTNNLQATGGSVGNISLNNATITSASEVQTNNAQVTGGSVTGVNPLSTSNAQITGGNISNNTVVSHTFLTNSLTSNIALNNNNGVFFDGPSVAQGTSGTWFATGAVTVRDSSSIATFYAQLTDGTTVIDSARADTGGVNQAEALTLAGVIASPAGNLKISVRCPTNNNGIVVWNDTGLQHDSTILAMRIG